MNKLYLFFALVILMFAMPSCGEKADLDKIFGNGGSGANGSGSTNNGNKPTTDGIIQTSGMVDLGLSVKWAARDLDASTGSHWATSCKVSGSGFYCATKDATYPSNIAGTSFDNATALLGTDWSTPTREQVEELVNNCKISYTIYEDVVGIIITGKNNKAIFINSDTEYWTSSVYNAPSSLMQSFEISSNCKISWDFWRYANLRCIRPVHQ